MVVFRTRNAPFGQVTAGQRNSLKNVRVFQLINEQRRTSARTAGLSGTTKYTDYMLTTGRRRCTPPSVDAKVYGGSRGDMLGSKQGQPCRIRVCTAQDMCARLVGL